MKRVLQIIHSEVADVSVVSKFFQKTHQSSTIFYKNLHYLKKKILIDLIYLYFMVENRVQIVYRRLFYMNINFLIILLN